MPDTESQLAKLTETPINFEYNSPSSFLINELKLKNNIVEIKQSKYFIIENSYYKQNLNGSSRSVYTRQAVLEKLHEAIQIMGYKFGFIIFDAFRSIETQKSIFFKIQQEIKNRNPNLSIKDLEIETRKFVAHPNEPARFTIPPHNSGGSIDLALFDLKTKNILDFGTEFDNTTDLARTDFFESAFDKNFPFSKKQWELIKKNRRMLFHTMTNLGFVNFESEWWHYSLGDCLWATYLNRPWVFDSMEKDVVF